MVDSLTSSESLSSGIETNPCCRINSSIRALRAIDVLAEVCEFIKKRSKSIKKGIYSPISLA
jgi:hypothetical protein